MFLIKKIIHMVMLGLRSNKDTTRVGLVVTKAVLKELH